MDKYRENAPCPKCGCGVIRDKYSTTASFGSYATDCAPFIQRTCSRCGYQWSEAPLDAKATQG